MTRVLFDLSTLHTLARTSGIGRYVAELALALDRLVHDEDPNLELIGLEQLGLTGPELSDDLTASVRKLEAARDREDRRLWATRLRLGLAAVTQSVAPDVVHTGDPRATPLGELKCPRIITCHDLVELRHPDKYVDWTDGGELGRRTMDQRRFHSADHVIAVSETTARDLVELVDVPAGKISVVPNGVDLERWSPEPDMDDRRIREHHDLSDRTYVLYVGAAGWRKNTEGMLSGLQAARRREPDLDIALVWAAELPAEQLRHVHKAIDELGLGGAVQLIGYAPDTDLGALYRGAAAQLFVSRVEGFGYPVVEAMACGCPVIASNQSSVAEIAGDAAWPVDPEDHESIGEAIATLAAASSERSRLSAQGTLRARRYSSRRMALATAEVYQLVAGT